MNPQIVMADKDLVPMMEMFTSLDLNEYKRVFFEGIVNSKRSFVLKMIEADPK